MQCQHTFEEGLHISFFISTLNVCVCVCVFLDKFFLS